jgi:membrane protein
MRSFRDDDLTGLSAELAFRWLLALFPLAIMIAALSGLTAQALSIQDPTGQIIDAAGQALPPDAVAVLRPQLERVMQGRDGALVSLGLALAIWAASSGMRAVIKGLNRAYDVEETRPLWRQLAVAVGLTVLLGLAIVGSFVALVVGQVLGRQLAAAVGLGDAATWIIRLAPVPVALVPLGVAVSLLYRLAPARHPGWQSVLPGVAVFVPGWIVATILFSLYVSNFASYDDTYGALGGVIVLLLFLYLTALLLILGGEVNAALERVREAQDRQDAARRGARSRTFRLAADGAPNDD